MPILVIAEHDNNFLKTPTHHVISAAQAISSNLSGGAEEIHVLVAGSACQTVVEQVATLDGVKKILVAEASYLSDLAAENIAETILANVGTYSHILAAATSFGKNVLPRVAARLDVNQISEIEKVVSDDTFVRSIYAGNALATVQTQDAIKVITVRITAFDPCIETVNTCSNIVNLSVPADKGLSRLMARELTALERADLSDARIVVSGGRGLGSREDFQKILEPLADKLGAAIGASRAAVDAGYISNDFQVGQTGKIVAPQLYFAIGISGAIQHLAGIKDSKVIVAINKDAEAPIFQVADYGLVADLFSVVPELITKL